MQPGAGNIGKQEYGGGGKRHRRKAQMLVRTAQPGAGNIGKQEYKGGGKDKQHGRKACMRVKTVQPGAGNIGKGEDEGGEEERSTQTGQWQGEECAPLRLLVRNLQPGSHIIGK